MNHFWHIVELGKKYFFCYDQKMFTEPFNETQSEDVCTVGNKSQL